MDSVNLWGWKGEGRRVVSWGEGSLPDKNKNHVLFWIFWASTVEVCFWLLV